MVGIGQLAVFELDGRRLAVDDVRDFGHFVIQIGLGLKA
jgi:hypothetical protein